MKTLYESILDNADDIVDKTSKRVESKLYKNYFAGDPHNIKWNPSTRTVTSLRGDYLRIYNDNGIPSIYMVDNDGHGKYVSYTEALPRNVTFNCNLNVAASILKDANFKLSDIPNVRGEKLRIFAHGNDQVATPAKIRNFIDCKPNFKKLIYPVGNKGISDILRLDCMGWFDGIEFSSRAYIFSDKEEDEFFNTTGIKAKMIWMQEMNFTSVDNYYVPNALRSYIKGTIDKDVIYYKFCANILKLLVNNPKLSSIVYEYDKNDRVIISLSNKGELTFKEN